MKKTGDQAQRDRARFELGANVVVEAGAGTGKTTLLTDRLLFTLLAGGDEGRGVDLTRIVALTFTEKAAGEIQLRLASRLSDLAAETGGGLPEGRRRDEARRILAEVQERFGVSPEAAAVTARAALERMDRALIGTIHHFASHLLRLYPLEAGVDPGFEVDDGAAFGELFESEWALWLDAELGERAPRREAWLEMLPSAGLEDLEALARSLCLEETRQCAPGATPAMRERLLALARGLRRVASKPSAPKSSKIVERAAKAAARLEDLAEACAGRGALAAKPDLEPVPVSAWPKAWEGDPDEDLYDEATALAKATSGDAERLVRRAALLVAPFTERFCERHRRRGFVSYFGLLRRARDLLRDVPAAREELKARFSALFIDEFQDTDPLQGELLLYLAEKRGRRAGSWEELELEPGKLFVVGDPKQSIYRFRGADIGAYERFAELLLSQGALKCDLRTSFRSHAGVIGPINEVHRALMRPVARLQPAYLPIDPFRAAPEPEAGPGVELVVAGLAEASADETRSAEAAWIARWIAERAGPGRPLAFRDIALLLRTTTALEPYLDALKDAGLPYAVEADRYFYGTQEVLDLLNLLRVLDDPEDRVSLAGLLRSPMCALDDRELYELALARRLDYREAPPAALAPKTRARLEGLWRCLRGLRLKAGREPLGDFMARVFRETFLVELASAAYYGEQTASNLLKFARLAAEAGESRGSTLKEFIGAVERSVRESAVEGESPLADEHLDAVRVLTIHKAKGLEWPVVLVPNVGARPSGGDGPSWRVDWSSGSVGLCLNKARAADAAMALLKREEAAREGYEAVRLLYVAMTRAKDHLILLGGRKPSAGSFGDLLSGAGAWPGPEAEASALTLGGWRVPVSREESEARRAPRSRRAQAQDLLSGAGAEFARRWTERRQAAALARRARTTSATAAPSAVPDAQWREEPSAAGPSAAALVGTACHRVLEHLDLSAPPDLERAVKDACRRLERERPSPHWPAIERETRDILGGFLRSAPARELAAAEILARELPFAYAREGQVVRGSIDLLCRTAGRLWVVDYKTDRVRAGEAKAASAAYREQGSVYREAVRRAMGEPCGFKLLFLRAAEIVECG